MQSPIYITKDINSYGQRPSKWGIEAGEFAPNLWMKKLYPTNPRKYFDTDNGVLVKINAVGLRGPEITMKKPPGVYRILGLGDSFAFGEGVRDEDTFLRRLEGSLNKRFGGSPKIEVLNAGVGGYDISDEALYLEKQWIDLGPDLVLITFYINDAYSEDLLPDTVQQDLLFFTPPPGLSQYSYLWDYIRYTYDAICFNSAINKMYNSALYQNPAQSLESPGKYTENINWPQSRQGLILAKQLSAKYGFRLGLVIFPAMYKLKDHPFNNVYDYIQGVCEGLEIPSHSLMDTFCWRDETLLWVHPMDHHPNEIGHAIAAEAIEPFLLELIGDKHTRPMSVHPSGTANEESSQ